MAPGLVTLVLMPVLVLVVMVLAPMSVHDACRARLRHNVATRSRSIQWDLQAGEVQPEAALHTYQQLVAR